MALLSIRNLSLAFGGPPLLHDISLQVNKGERICLLGRNGMGKSTLLKLIAAELPPDSGTIERQQGLHIAALPQEVPRDLTGSVYAAIADGLGEQGRLLSRYRELSVAVEAGNEGMLPRLLDIQHDLDRMSAWALQPRIEQLLSQLKLDGDAPIAHLSGGMARRALLARALAGEPDILLLDEPTNHLDIDSIDWLENFLKRESLTLIFVTHDRAFLRALATRIIEIDRGRLYDFACDYPTFLLRKEELLHAETLEWQRFDKKLAEEEIWIRKGIKARRTRNEGRVRALKQMRDERRRRRERLGNARLGVQETERSGKLVAELTDVTFDYNNVPTDKPLIRNFSTTILRGDRIGIIGANGAGKTTLIKLLLGELQPLSGTVKLGTHHEIVYIDQLRDQLDPDKTVQQNLAGEQDTVQVGGQARHVIGYLQDFLFTPERARTPVRILSGGECNRLLLAKQFMRPANILILDEPTNDLDLETLDLLEELLADFPGTIFLVSHDRAFINQVVTSTIAFEGDGRVVEYVGDYDDWVRQRPAVEYAPPSTKEKKEKPLRERQRKLTFKEKHELEGLPQHIDALEAKQAELHQRMADPNFYREAGAQMTELKTQLETVTKELENAFARWEELAELVE
ncbi:MAG: ATP-binding cassette domain-containing protein [Desulfuromonadales bacterium]|nr:ATP-binding cassette domain-containing protein [Desulfuromonadales bacterium]MDT8422760.1 ATP-binding cassette domain-containing protein [Desulfuromonadales bacterium]